MPLRGSNPTTFTSSSSLRYLADGNTEVTLSEFGPVVVLNAQIGCLKGTSVDSMSIDTIVGSPAVTGTVYSAYPGCHGVVSYNLAAHERFPLTESR